MIKLYSRTSIIITLCRSKLPVARKYKNGGTDKYLYLFLKITESVPQKKKRGEKREWLSRVGGVVSKGGDNAIKGLESGVKGWERSVKGRGECRQKG